MPLVKVHAVTTGSVAYTCNLMNVSWCPMALYYVANVFVGCIDVEHSSLM